MATTTPPDVAPPAPSDPTLELFYAAKLANLSTDFRSHVLRAVACYERGSTSPTVEGRHLHATAIAEEIARARVVANDFATYAPLVIGDAALIEAFALFAREAAEQVDGLAAGLAPWLADVERELKLVDGPKAGQA